MKVKTTFLIVSRMTTYLVWALSIMAGKVLLTYNKQCTSSFRDYCGRDRTAKLKSMQVVKK